VPHPTGSDRTRGGAKTLSRGPVKISGRTAALGVVLFVLMLAYAYPLRVYLAQRAEIAQLEEDQRAQRDRIRQLAADVARWNDDEYVKAEALRRLLLVEVGEQVYVVGVDPTATQAEGDPTPPAWYEQVWTSVQTADNPPTP
jgi:cell division protein FtsB